MTKLGHGIMTMIKLDQSQQWDSNRIQESEIKIYIELTVKE